MRTRHSIRAGIAVALLPLLAGATDDSCRLCAPSSDVKSEQIAREVPISLGITANLDFSKAALTGLGGGQIKVNPEGGQRSVGGGLIDLGGYPTAGSAIVRGEPGRPVRIDLPGEVRMTSSTGGVIRISELRTNLPPVPRLDASGQLSFSFGGKLEISGNMAGTFRGRIALTANYE